MFQAQSHTRESHIMHQCLEVSIGSHPMEETNIDKETAIAVVVDPLHTYIHTYRMWVVGLNHMSFIHEPPVPCDLMR